MGNKLEILQLLENGSITAEEAERLLDTAEHEELEAFRQEMREQMAAIQNAAEDARCAAADARCAADEAEEYADGGTSPTPQRNTGTMTMTMTRMTRMTRMTGLPA